MISLNSEFLTWNHSGITRSSLGEPHHRSFFIFCNFEFRDQDLCHLAVSTSYFFFWISIQQLYESTCSNIFLPQKKKKKIVKATCSKSLSRALIQTQHNKVRDRKETPIQKSLPTPTSTPTPSKHQWPIGNAKQLEGNSSDRPFFILRS